LYNVGDYNHDGVTTPAELIQVINKLNSRTELNDIVYDAERDVTNDGILTPLDTIIIVNAINEGRRTLPRFASIDSATGVITFAPSPG